MNPSLPPNGGVGLEPPAYVKPKSLWNILYNSVLYLNHKILTLNGSKLFAGLVIITLNISSKFVTIKLSKSMEAYLKYTFSRDVLIFAMAWMGTRDIYIALLMTLLFKVCANYLFNENSRFCLLPEQFTTYHSTLAENDTVTDQQYTEALLTVAKYEGEHPNFSGDSNTSPATAKKEGFAGYDSYIQRVDKLLSDTTTPPRVGELLENRKGEIEPYDNY
jgi:hypothetical protein